MLAKDSRILFLFIVCVVALGQVATDIYLPSLPELVQLLKTDADSLQLTLTVFLLGFGTGQIISGPSSDQFGRRALLLLGLTIFTLGTLICIFVTSYYELMLGRLIQGLGIGCGGVVARAATRDLYSGVHLAQVTAAISVALSVSPILAPAIGGFIHEIWGWQANFLFLAGYVSVLLFFIWRFFPETHERVNKPQLGLTTYVTNYRTVLSNKIFWQNAICIMLGFAAFVSFLSISPFILQTSLGFTPKQYGLLMICVALGYMSGSFTNNRLIGSYGALKMMRVGSLFQVSGSVAVVTFALLGICNVYTVLVPMMLYVYGSGLINPGAMSGILMPFPKIAGTAGAAMGSFVILGAAFWSFITAVLPSEDLRLLALIMSLCSGTIFFNIYYVMSSPKTA